MGSSSSKFRKHLQAGDEVQALQLYRANSELRKALDPNCSYGDSYQHETPLHLAAKHGMQTLLGIFLFSKGGNPKKTNARKETCLHCVCMETNTQSVHEDKRRADCLNYLLKWRGSTLAGGQVEKVDLSSQDEKLNTALHYAAASGLTQCVEILIQHGAPLFIENEDSLTPCDTAEKNGHARIALYLESKMVFSTDEEPHNDDDDVSMPPVEEYSGLRPQDLQEAKDHLLVETADMLSVPLFTAEALLRNHEWSREMLLESWMNDPIACCEKCGVTPPSSLFSEKPEVQENLASPLPSPLHANPSPQDVECNICANIFLLADEPVHMTCTHKFCKDCWERYLNVKIQEGDAHRITCPAYNCTMLVPIDIIERIVSRDMTLRYLQFDIKAFVDSNPDMKWCPYPGCGRAVKLPDLDVGMSQSIKRNKIPSDTSRGVDCGVGHYFCWECLEESHEPCSCDNWSKWFQKINEIKPETLDGTEQETELAANCLWLVTNSKPCPNCKSPIQKNEGCNHMKCSKCKFDFCWVCLEQWKRHNSSTGGYFKCNRYEVLKKVEEQCAQMVSEAEMKSRKMQELNRFVHYYTRFKNHENSYKLEEPLLKTVKEKMMKLAEAVTDNATAHAETKFVEDAVQQLLKARRVLKCSYVYGYYLDGPGYKKIVFEFMQTELEECIEILSQMVNRLYLRTPRRKIMDQAHFVQRKRLEFIMAISKGLVPPETPPSARKSKMKRKISGGEADDEDLHRAIVASIQEIDPSNPWIKDASGKHTNVVALMEWPSDDSEQSDFESEQRAARESIGKCHKSDCNKVRVKNPRTNEHHDYCSRWCMEVDKQNQNTKETEGASEIVQDEHMELLRALEMSRLQYLRDNGLLGVSDSPDIQQANKETDYTRMLNSVKELSREMQKWKEGQQSHSSMCRGDTKGPSEEKKHLKKSKAHNFHKLSQSSRFDECRSTIVTQVPNKSVEDLYCLDQAPKSQKTEDNQSPEEFDETSGYVGDGLFVDDRTMPALSLETLQAERGPCFKVGNISSLESSIAANRNTSCSSSSMMERRETVGSMFGVIKDISISNIHSSEGDKTKDFLAKDLASIFSSWDSDNGQCRGSTNRDSSRRPLTMDCPSSSMKAKYGKPSMGHYYSYSDKVDGRESEPWLWLPNAQQSDSIDDDDLVDDDVDDDGLDKLKQYDDFSKESTEANRKTDGDISDLSLLQITEDTQDSIKEMEDSSDESADDDCVNVEVTGDLFISDNDAKKYIENIDHSVSNNESSQQWYHSNTDTDNSSQTQEQDADNSSQTQKQDADNSSQTQDTENSSQIQKHYINNSSQMQDTDNSNQTQKQDTDVAKFDKPAIQLPRTAWLIEDKDVIRSSLFVSKATHKSSSQKTKVFDTDAGHQKSPSSTKSKKSKGGVVGLALVHDTGVNCRTKNLKAVGEILGDIGSDSKLSFDRNLDVSPSSRELLEKSGAQGRCSRSGLSLGEEPDAADSSVVLSSDEQQYTDDSSNVLSLNEQPYTADSSIVLSSDEQPYTTDSSTDIDTLQTESNDEHIDPSVHTTQADDIMHLTSPTSTPQDMSEVVTFGARYLSSAIKHVESLHPTESSVCSETSLHPTEPSVYSERTIHPTEPSVCSETTIHPTKPSVYSEISLHSTESSVYSETSLHPTELSVYSEMNRIAYSLSRNISCEMLSSHSCLKPETLENINITLHTKTASTQLPGESNDTNTSALIAAASEDTWEDASPVLPPDDRQFIGTDQDCQQLDTHDVFSLYV